MDQIPTVKPSDQICICCTMRSQAPVTQQHAGRDHHAAADPHDPGVVALDPAEGAERLAEGDRGERRTARRARGSRRRSARRPRPALAWSKAERVDGGEGRADAGRPADAEERAEQRRARPGPVAGRLWKRNSRWVSQGIRPMKKTPMHDHQHAEDLGQDVPVLLEGRAEVAEERAAGDEHGGEAEHEQRGARRPSGPRRASARSVPVTPVTYDR